MYDFLPCYWISDWDLTGALVSVDSYMNLQLVNTEEFIDSKFQGNLGEVLIRYSRYDIGFGFLLSSFHYLKFYTF